MLQHKQQFKSDQIKTTDSWWGRFFLNDFAFILSFSLTCPVCNIYVKEIYWQKLNIK